VDGPPREDQGHGLSVHKVNTMKKSILFICILLAFALNVEARGLMMVGGGVAAAASCASGTVNVSQTLGNHDQEIRLSSGRVYGQSFKFTSAGKIYSITITISLETASENKTAYLRFGTSTDLSSASNIEVTLVNGTTGDYEVIIPTHPDVDTDTTYYWGIRSSVDADTGFYLGFAISDELANGIMYYGNSDGTWSLANELATSDIAFKASLCN
jgi:hypothetical protein